MEMVAAAVRVGGQKPNKLTIENHLGVIPSLLLASTELKLGTLMCDHI